MVSPTKQFKIDLKCLSDRVKTLIMIVTLNSLIINWKSEQVLFKVYKVCMNDNDTHNYNFVTSKCSIIITLLNRLNCNYRKKDSSLSRFVSVINYKWSILKEFVTKMGLC